MDSSALLHALVEQVAFHGSKGVNLEVAFQELAESGIVTDASQKLFLRRALLSVKGIWTLSNDTGEPIKARASRDIQDSAMGCKSGSHIALNDIQKSIVRGVGKR